MKISKLVLCSIPSSCCNFHCDYCYVSQISGRRKDKIKNFEYPVEHMLECLSPKRLGGICCFIITADGETTLQPKLIDFVFGLLKEGHVVEITTNCSLPVINEYLKFPDELLCRLVFKVSLHYLELKKLKLLEQFTKNVNNIINSKASCSIELLASDIYIPYIDEIKKYCIDNFGALPQLSIDRNDRTKIIDYSTKDLNKFLDIYNHFDSELFKFKKSIFLKPIKFYCYSGEYVLFINLTNGTTNQCYNSIYSFNIFSSHNEPLKLISIGRHCSLSHCYNGHGVLAFGSVPNKYNDISYYLLRDRNTTDGRKWIKESVKQYYSSKLHINNSRIIHKLYNEIRLMCYSRKLYLISLFKRRQIHNNLKKHIKKHYLNNIS